MIGAIMAGAGALSGLLQSMGSKDAASAQARALSPQAALYRYNMLYPDIAAAFRNEYTPDAGPYQQAWHKYINQIGQLDPTLYNQAFQQAQMGTGQAMNAMFNTVGTGVPGMANMIPLAAQGMTNQNMTNLAFNRAVDESNRLRSDLYGLANLRMGLMGQSSQQQQAAAPAAGASAGLGWSSILGNAIQGGLAAYGTMQQPNQQNQQTGTGNFPQMQNQGSGGAMGYDFTKPVQAQQMNNNVPVQSGGLTSPILPTPTQPAQQQALWAPQINYQPGG